MLLLSAHNGRMEATEEDHLNDNRPEGNHPSENGQIHQTAEQEQRHAEFVAALDNLTSSMGDDQDGMLDQLTADLAWDRSEVEIYAYRYMAALVETSEEDYSAERLRERRQLDYLTRANPGLAARGTWSPADTRLLQSLLATMTDVDGAGVNIVPRLARFFPGRAKVQVERQIAYLRERQQVAETMEESV
jgi:hypothetical protein